MLIPKRHAKSIVVRLALPERDFTEVRAQPHPSHMPASSRDPHLSLGLNRGHEVSFFTMWSVRDTDRLEALLSWASSLMPDTGFPALQDHYLKDMAISLGNKR
jgi:hypothetical protein